MLEQKAREDERAVTIIETSVAEMRTALDRGDYTIRALTEACIARIQELDRQGPTLGAVIEINPDALAIADCLDGELAAGQSRGPLHGIPILLKDNIATVDPMETTAGSLALVGARPLEDAFLVKRLRDAGVVILGKANLSEWSNFRSEHSISGWSARGGQALNPYQLDRTPWGSSAGPAVAVAASYVPLAVGTETNGSIVMPAGVCGVVGIKPTVGLVSRMGVIPISHSQDTAGPMTRTVADAAMLLQVLAAPDPDDQASHGTPGTPDAPSYPARPADVDVDYLAALDPDGLRGARIGVLTPFYELSRSGDRILADVISTLREAGAEIVDPVIVPPTADQKWGAGDISVLFWEFKADIAEYIERYVSPSFPIRDLEGLIAFNEAHASSELQWFGQDLFERAQGMTSLDDPAYVAAIARSQRCARAEGLDLVLTDHRLDAVIALTNGPAPKIDLLNGDSSSHGSSGLAARAGYPLITVPAAHIGGMPIGLTFMGGAYSEATLICLAYAFEQRTKARRPPEFVPAGVHPPEMPVA
ncbi:MAG: amidase [Thermomicrobiales bacterium]